MSKRLFISLLLCAAIHLNAFPQLYAKEVTAIGNGNTLESSVLKIHNLSQQTVVNDSSNNFTNGDCECEKENSHSDPLPFITPSLNILYKSYLENYNPLNGWIGTVPAFYLNDILLLPLNSYFLLLLTLSCLIAFFSGWYLRFRSGLAPGIYV